MPKFLRETSKHGGIPHGPHWLPDNVSADGTFRCLRINSKCFSVVSVETCQFIGYIIEVLYCFDKTIGIWKAVRSKLGLRL